MGTINNTIIIEEISRNHKLNARHKYDKPTISLGRSYQNDVIITDHHVNPEHISITFNGEYWQLSDLNTINGSFLGESKKQIQQHIIQSGDIIRIGKSYIRFILPHQSIAQTHVLNPYDSVIEIARSPIFIMAVISLFTVLSGYLAFISSPKEVSISQFSVSAISVTLAFAFWPLGVSLVSLLTKHESRVWHQLGISFVFFNAFLLLDFIETLIFFNTSSNAVIIQLLPLFTIALVFSLIWLNCYIGFTMSAVRRIVVSLGLVIFFFGSYALINKSKQPKFSLYPSYDSTLLPPKFLLKSPTNIDTFIEEAEKTLNKSKIQMEKMKEAAEK